MSLFFYFIYLFYFPHLSPQIFRITVAILSSPQGNVSAYKPAFLLRTGFAVPSVPVTITADAFWGFEVSGTSEGYI